MPPVLAFQDPIVVTGCAGSVADGGLFFGEGYSGNLHRMLLPGTGAGDRTPVDEVLGTFDGGITDVETDREGSLWVVTPTALYRQMGAIEDASPLAVRGLEAEEPERARDDRRGS